MSEVWPNYLRAVRHLHDVGRRIAAIGVKTNPTQAELDSIDGLIHEHSEAENEVARAIEAGRVELRALKAAKRPA